MKATNLIKNISYIKVLGNIDREIKNIQMDSRLISEGDCFVCIKGSTVDGHKYIEETINQGAVLIVLEEMPEVIRPQVLYVQVKDTMKALSGLANAFYHFPSQDVCSIGVTGTNGKTTVANMISAALRNMGDKTAVMGTLGIDVDGEKIESENTTVDSLTMQRTYAKMVKKNVNTAVLEVSSHGLSLGRLAGVEFQTAIFTNLTQDHLDFHKTMENYAQAKSLLFSGLGQNLSKNKTAILNSDDKCSEFLEKTTSAKIMTYGIVNASDVSAKEISYDGDKTTFTVAYKGSEEVFETNFIGEFNVYNCLASVAALLDRGYCLKEIKNSFFEIFPVDGRMEKVENKEGLTIYIDYAHTPDGIEKALIGMRKITKGKVYCVIGAGGNRDVDKRPIMAEKASENADFVILTTDNPRDEPFESIMAGMEKGLKHKNYLAIGDRRVAIKEALERITQEDALIVMGKGPETYQIIKGVKHHFNDKETVLEFFTA